MSYDTNIRVSVAFDTLERSKFEGCDALVFFGDDAPATSIPTIVVTKDYKIKLHTFPKMPKKLSEDYLRICDLWLSEVYSKPYSYIAKRFGYLNAEVDIFSLIRRRKSYYNTAIALSIPLFFLKEGVPHCKPTILLGFDKFENNYPLSLYKWILSPIAYFFTASEYWLDRNTNYQLRSQKEIVRSFLSFLCWEETELYVSYVEFFIDFIKKRLLERGYEGLGYRV